ncbi:DUF3793 family protein [Treponema brennaborense]|uniref:DUF3793 domain-containing protein n=1 Tax=Treponema brennaborense (strain DSM 12168 / CIP 105900 / DD5/3) TaxID=906968 RepID=F4LLI3_TREBD|nr:DUF3793 family protein [Treponema brennaborense]AEE16647.1 hypothetical protein Trebr_1219 [Treponema brennaborense DSM 12168]
MSIERTIIHFCAPSLCGIKAASLVSVGKDTYRQCLDRIRNLDGVLRGTGKRIVPVTRTENRTLLFVYDEALLNRRLCDPQIARYLGDKGYPVAEGAAAVLPAFLKRLSGAQRFPHETGVFLGYPLEDVVGFEAHGGCGCKYCGYWKVYGDVESARLLCSQYERCRTLCKQWFEEGHSIPRLIEKYTERQGAA